MSFYDSLTKIIRRGNFQLILKDGRRKTLPSLFNIPGLDRNLIYVSKISDASVRTMFDIHTYKMVWGDMVLVRGIRIRMLYKLLGRIDGSSCLLAINPKTNDISSCIVD